MWSCITYELYMNVTATWTRPLRVHVAAACSGTTRDAFTYKVNWTCFTNYHMRSSVASTGCIYKEQSELLSSLYIVSLHLLLNLFNHIYCRLHV